MRRFCDATSQGRPPGYPVIYNPQAGSGTDTAIAGVIGNGAEQRPAIWLADAGTYFVKRSNGASVAAFGANVDVTSRYVG